MRGPTDTTTPAHSSTLALSGASVVALLVTKWGLVMSKERNKRPVREILDLRRRLWGCLITSPVRQPWEARRHE